MRLVLGRLPIWPLLALTVLLLLRGLVQRCFLLPGLAVLTARIAKTLTHAADLLAEDLRYLLYILRD